MLTVHLLTKNNAQTIQKTLDSVQWCDQILVADLGSTDNTIQICEHADAEVIQMDCPRNEARNILIDETRGPTFMIEPWEVLVSGQEFLSRFDGSYYASVVQNKTISKEIRAWTGDPKFVNPVYEAIDGDAKPSNIAIYSQGRSDQEDILKQIQDWKKLQPTSIAPYYYEACTMLSLGKWQQFLQLSEHYMFIDKSMSISATMNRYYYALACLMHSKNARYALQNLTLCIATKPLMAEFWCLAGDVHYHLTKQFHVAKELYDNAIILGQKRLKTDIWPMDLAKYKTYPTAMIESCDKILASKSLYVKTSPQDG